MKLSSLGEFGLLRRVWSRLGPPRPGVVLGSGDDAAVLTGGPEQFLLVSTDAMVEGVHFRTDWLSPGEIGQRAARAALSDLAAMGGLPRGVLASVVLSGDLEAEFAEDLIAGLQCGAEACGAGLIGGDVARSPGPLFLDVVALGETSCYWPRCGAQVGDVVVVSGDLGRSAAALRTLQQGCSLADLPPLLRERFLFPEPAFDLVRALQPLELVTAAIDLSDGLVADLGHLAENSGVQVCLRAAAVPWVPEIEVAARAAGMPPQAMALQSGEEYELAVTLPADALERAKQAVAAAGARPLTVIGEVRAGGGVVVDDAPPDLPQGGWDHFRPTAEEAGPA